MWANPSYVTVETINTGPGAGNTFGAGTGAFSITGTLAGLSNGQGFTAGVGAVAIAGTAGGLVNGSPSVFGAGVGAATITGTSGALSNGQGFGAGVGAVLISGVAGGLTNGQGFGVGVGSIVFTGEIVGLTNPGGVIAGTRFNYPVAPPDLADERQHRQLLARVVNGALAGKTNNVGTVTLTASTTSTTYVHALIGYSSALSFHPLTASAAAALGSLYSDNFLNGQCTLHHASSASADQNFRVVIVG